MIEIRVADYCIDCPAFEADVVKEDKTYFDGSETQAKGNTIIRCKSRKHCERLVRYLMSKVGD